VDQLRTNRFDRAFRVVRGLVRNSAVVLAELWRGARHGRDRDFIWALQHNHPTLLPTENNWIESGQILAKMSAQAGYQPAKLRDLHFDVLIALTARSHGARLITSNKADFELIREYKKVEIEFW
jgi:predicted nucleic acid-binding protein